jgi:hypothetical protein
VARALLFAMNLKHTWVKCRTLSSVHVNNLHTS